MNRRAFLIAASCLPFLGRFLKPTDAELDMLITQYYQGVPLQTRAYITELTVPEGY